MAIQRNIGEPLRAA